MPGEFPDERQSWSAIFQIAVWRLVLFIAIPIAILGWGGAVHMVLLETPGPPETKLDAGDRSLAIVLAGLASAIAGGGFWKLWRLQGRLATFFVVLIGMTFSLSMGMAEIAARLRRPPWPAADLHGVMPQAGNEPWSSANQIPGAVEGVSIVANSWGQRDRERTLSPPQGLRRIAFIGDSFLEESPGEPVSLAVERLIDSSQWEVINLGVSATAPDEYFYRLKQIAVPLGCEACVMFVYLGNDLAGGPRTLESVAGVTAVTPRQSFLNDLGLAGLNHLLMNSRRPLLHAWFAAGDLAAQERALFQKIQQSSDLELAQFLVHRTELPAQLSQLLHEKLLKPEMAPFYEMLRHPDAGRFRSYYLTDGVWLAATGTPPVAEDRIDYAAHWIEESARLCAHKQMPFLCVLIPDGFAVDPRLRNQWSPLADMSQLAEPTSQRGAELAMRLAGSGITVLSLQDALNDVPGTYLNLDGHWSDLGVQRTAEAVAHTLSQQFAIPLEPEMRLLLPGREQRSQ